ncbi:MAG TPA: metallopeptidase TldD-related protein [Bryobacteraceae bacterium]|jgi:PmbA protein|nr:metallopeptidase TldD-related protein [Bryobacteraceae bacterium]
MSDLENLASDAVKRALAAGATDAECTIMEGEEFSSAIRMREVESLKEAGSRAAGIRVLVGKYGGSSYTSDLTPEGIATMVRGAIDLAKITSEDPFAGLPEESDLGSRTEDLALYDDAIEGMETEWKIAQAKRAEEVAFETDARIQNSEGASFDSYVGRRVFVNSLGFSGSYRTSSCGLSVSPVAKQNGSMERDYWYTSARAASKLESPDEVGRRAAERAVRRLNPRKIPTQKASILFEPRTARSLLGDLFDAVNGGAIYRHASFLAGKLGEKIASESLTVVDDATLRGLFGSSPFDDEGVICRRTVVIEKGVLNSYLLNSYTARKLGLKTTGNASRGITGNAGVGPGNFFIEAGERSPESILKAMKTGLYVTELIGGDTNTVTGDYSSGAAGLWIENGELAYPVSEITIAGNMKQMLLDMEIGSDLEFRGSIASPSLLIREMTISGQ